MSSDDSSGRSHMASCGTKRGGSPEKLSPTSSDASNEPQSKHLKAEVQILTEHSALESVLLPWQAGPSNSNPPLLETSQPPPPPTRVNLLSPPRAFESPHPKQRINLNRINKRGYPLLRVTNFRDLMTPRSVGLLGRRNKHAMQYMGGCPEVTNKYRLPTSNSPLEFRLEASSTIQVPLFQLSNTQFDTRFGSGTRVSSLVKTKPVDWQPRNQINMHEHSTSMGVKKSQIQGLLNQAAGSRNWRASGVPSQRTQFRNMPTHQMKGIPSTSISTQRMKSQAPARYLRNSLYDPRYEAMGLPVDPILRRIFHMKNNKSRK